jgi:hypothetical protein
MFNGSYKRLAALLVAHYPKAKRRFKGCLNSCDFQIFTTFGKFMISKLFSLLY